MTLIAFSLCAGLAACFCFCLAIENTPLCGRSSAAEIALWQGLCTCMQDHCSRQRQAFSPTTYVGETRVVLRVLLIILYRCERVEYVGARLEALGSRFVILASPVKMLRREGIVMFYHLGRIAARYRWLIVGVWMVAVVVALPFAPRASGVLQSGGFISPDAESERAVSLLTQKLGLQSNIVQVIFTSRTYTAMIHSSCRSRSRPWPVC